MSNAGEGMPRANAKPYAVLVVDDEPALLRVTARLLEVAGFAVTACASGPEAAQRLMHESFDVVLSDLEMPELGGIALLKMLREHDIDVPVVLITGAPTLDSAMTAVEYGAFKYLTKPVPREELVATVERAAREGGARSGARRRGQSDVATPEDRGAITEGAVLLDRYRLCRLIGSGGMSQVWEASHLLTQRLVAVKVLHATLNAQPQMRRRLLREARAATAFEHPNIVEIFDVFELPDATPVIIMELLHGRTLRDRLDQAGHLELEEAARLLLQVVSAVGSAHAHGVIHRDVKPDNVFLCGDGDRVKVVDFGIAKLVHADAQNSTSSTATGSFVGTIGYMAPEQALGERNIDHRVDVWSIGAVLYEALAGERPVPGSSLGQVIGHLLGDRIVPLHERAPGIPSSLAALVDRMLARDADARSSDLREAYVELSRHTAHVAPSFGPPSSAAPAPRDPLRSSDVPLAHALTELEDSRPPAPREGRRRR